jgi:hypothetical protein
MHSPESTQNSPICARLRAVAEAHDVENAAITSRGSPTTPAASVMGHTEHFPHPVQASSIASTRAANGFECAGHNGPGRGAGVPAPREQ